MENLYVRMLGGFSISIGNKVISYRDNRSKRIWLLLAYLIYHRHRIVLQAELMNLLWGEGEQGTNPTGALKTTLHRARQVLEGLWPGAGHQLILSQSGGYVWSSQVPLAVDIDQFDKLCREGDDTEERTDRDYQAVQLYGGDFLAHVASESWVIPIAAYYRNRYMQSLLRVLPELMEQERYSEVAGLCQVAATVEPFHEEVHLFMMRALLKLGDHKGVESVYHTFSQRMSVDFGVLPSQEIRESYYEAIKTDNGQMVSVEELKEQLKEDGGEGAFICEYDFFRVLYRFMSRFMERCGIVTHIALLSVTGKGDKKLSERKRKGAMEGLEEQLRECLRQGDCAAKCSVSQYVLMLPQANYENSCTVCERIRKAFYRRHPHSDAEIRYVVYSLSPREESFALDKKEVINGNSIQE